MLKLESACVSYQQQQTLTDICLHIPRGQKVAIIGRSGAGKSTLLNLLYQQRPHDIALVPQDYGLVKSLSVFHNVYMGQLGQNPLWYNLVNLLKPLQKPVEQVTQILHSVQLADKLFEPVGQLSGGQQQRTAIGRAMMRGGDILCADEPVSSLDEQQSRLVMKALCQRFETVVMAMHDISLAIDHCDRIIGLDGGRISIDASTDNLQCADLLDIFGE
ncbi:MAG: phosphonate transport system ATP-binding protein [Phenylobacterium sp.]|jgi:phosphonate transport system ATP-binding protein